MRTLRGIYIIWYRDVLNLWRSKTRIVTSLMFPLLFLFIFGGGLTRSIGFLAPGVDYAQFMFPGIVGMTVLMNSMNSGVSVVWDREFGFLKEILVAPIHRMAVAAGKTLGGATVAVLQGVLMFIFAPFVGVSMTPLLALQLLPFMIVLALSITSLGIFIASRMRSMESHMMVMQMLMFPMVFLSGAFFPVNNLPSWLGVLVKINPATYGIDPIRQLVLSHLATASAPLGLTNGQGMDSLGVSLFGRSLSIWEEVAIIGLFGVVMVVLAMRSFNVQE